MKAEKPFSRAQANDEIATLIETLHRTGQRLEQLTAGEVDAVADPEGRTFLLQHAQDHLRRSEAAKQAAILNALPAHIALLDSEGRIISVNQAWRRFADANGLQATGHGIGLSYLDICDRARGDDSIQAQAVATGIRSVLATATESFSIEYPCHSPGEQRWFLMAVTPLTDEHLHGAVVMHLDITRRKREEEAALRFGSAMDAINDAIYLVDRSSMRFIHVNDTACRMRNQTREELLAMKPWELLSTSRNELERIYDAVIAGGVEAEPLDIQRSREDGSPVWLELRRHALRTEDRWTIVTLVRDITERKLALDKIRRLNRVYAVLSGINTLIVRTQNRQELFDEACRITVAQGGFRLAWIGLLGSNGLDVTPVAKAGFEEGYLDDIRLTGAEDVPNSCALLARGLLQRKPEICNDIATDPQMARWREEALRRGYRSMAMFPLQNADQVWGVLFLYSAEIDCFDFDEMKLLTELAGDIAFAIDHLEKEEKLNYLAYYDVLTGLANRSLFLERVGQYLSSAASGGYRLALYLIDLERFKNLNDSLGRQAGDELLRQVAEWLKRNVGDVNLVARVGTDHFAVVMPKVKPEGNMVRLLEKWMEAFMQHPFRLNDAVFRIAFKGGAALYPDDGTDADTLFRNAEAALKKAKASGVRYLFHTQEMTEAVAGRLTLENQLRQALDNEEFVLHYQPKINLASGKITSAEALIRWNDPRTGLVPPRRFIPILEETGLIHEVGRWALKQAIADYLRWRAADLPAVRIAVNVSSLQLRSPRFIDEVSEVIGIDPQAAAGLELEITESLIMENVNDTIASLQAIRALGICIAIDDFGTGFSSLSYLAKLPVDTLKIDRSFVIEMTLAPEGLALVSTIIDLAHSLKLKVVAEGVETEEQSRLLRLLNCDEMQGFLFSKPVPAEIFETKFLVPLPGG